MLEDNRHAISSFYANAVKYYMKEHGVSREKASKGFERMIGDINKDCKRRVSEDNHHAATSSYANHQFWSLFGCSLCWDDV